MEEENDGCLPFLDILVYKKNDKLGHRVYRKPTHTDKYLHFSSFHHRSQKVAVIDSLVYRGLKISDEDNLNQELDHIRSCLKDNGYPAHLIESRIKSMIIRVNQAPTPKIEKNWCAIPFCGKPTLQVARILRSHLQLNICYKVAQRIGSLFSNYKDKSTINEKDCGVYSVECGACSSVYIGETKRNYKIRLKEHAAHVRRAEFDKSAVAQHAWEQGHVIDFTTGKLIAREPRWLHRRYKEALLIKKAQQFGTTINLDNGMEMHPSVSTTLLPLIP